MYLATIWGYPTASVPTDFRRAEAAENIIRPCYVIGERRECPQSTCASLDNLHQGEGESQAYHGAGRHMPTGPVGAPHA